MELLDQVVSNSLWPHGLQHARLPCPSLSPRVCLHSCPLSWWCHPFNSSSVVPFSCPQSFLELGSSPMSRLFVSGDQSIASAPRSSNTRHGKSFQVPARVPQAFLCQSSLAESPGLYMSSVNADSCPSMAQATCSTCSPDPPTQKGQGGAWESASHN